MDFSKLLSCCICPRKCAINRYSSTGYCGADAELKVNLSALHHGEEPPISGTQGSGTIFFSWCNLHCVYCQNHEISALGWGSNIEPEELVSLMLALQEKGAHNINLVTPTHYSIQLIPVIMQAKQQGLNIPIVWNSSAYEIVEVLQSLAGLVDIYLPDLKYAHGIYASKYSHAPDYPAVSMLAIKEMFSQVGTLKLDANAIALKGMIVRLLILPSGISGTKQSLHRIAGEIGTDVTLSIMSQYYPAGTAMQYPELSSGISQKEYDSVLETATELGFNSVYCQELSCSDIWTPKFVSQPSGILQTPIKDFCPSMEI